MGCCRNLWKFRVATYLGLNIHLIFFNHLTVAKAWEGTLIFQDDFEEDFLNPVWEKIGNCEGKGHKDTNLECFTKRDENIYLKNGLLIIEATPENWIPEELWATPKNFTSGRVKMINSLGYQLGTYVIRARLAKGMHLFSSLYLLPAYQDHDNCKYEEVDIAQMRGQRASTVMVGAYYGRQWNHASARKVEKAFKNIDFSQDFHEFALVWKKYRMEWFVYGRLVYTVPMFYYSDWLLHDESNLPCNNDRKMFQQKLQLNIALSIGGTMFPQVVYGDLTFDDARNWTKPNIEIDWVKIYQ